MRRAAGGAGPRLLAASLAVWLGGGCAWLPADLFDWLPSDLLEDPAAEETPAPALPPPLEDCAVLSILIDTSQQGDPAIAERARRAMSRELRRFGATITDSPESAYWSLMILATQNSRRDGFILNALLTARSGTESGGPGMTVFAKEAPGGNPEPEPGSGPEVEPGAAADRRGVPTLYSGLAFGPHAQLDRRARELSRQAYTAVYPAAQRMCEYEATERARERDLEAQTPQDPEPL